MFESRLGLVNLMHLQLFSGDGNCIAGFKADTSTIVCSGYGNWKLVCPDSYHPRALVARCGTLT